MFQFQTHHCALQRCFRTRCIQISFMACKAALRTGTCFLCTRKVNLIRPLYNLCHDSHLLRQNGDESGHQRCFLFTAVLMDFEDYERDRAEKKLLMKLQEAEEAVKDGEGWLDLDELKALVGE